MPARGGAPRKTVPDQTVKSRYVLKQLDKKSYSFKWEIQGPDGQWKTVSEGKSTRS